MAKLTEAQLRCLASVAAGAVHMHFDVYGGYRWTNGEHSTRERRSVHEAPKPISRLLALAMIEAGQVARPYSGHQITPYIITDAGREALKAEQGR